MKPICATTRAVALMREVAADVDAPEALMLGACAVAMHKMDSVSVGQVVTRLDHLANVIRNRVRGSQPQAVLAHLHEMLFEEQGFKGSADDYYKPDNYSLPAALETKTGCPTILGLIYKLVADRLGLRVWGIGLPGYYLCGVDIDGSVMLIDPFNGGRLMTRDEVANRITLVSGSTVHACDLNVTPESNRHWLTRILQSLLNIYGACGNYADVAAMLELEMILWPEQVRLYRDLALVYARIGLGQPARQHLDHYLRRVPDDPQGGDLRQLLGVLAE